MAYRVFVFALCGAMALDQQAFVRGDTRSYKIGVGPGLRRTLGRLRCRVAGAEVVAPPLTADLTPSSDVYRFVRGGASPAQSLIVVAQGAPAPVGAAGDLLVGWCRTGMDEVEEETEVSPRMRLLVPTPAPESETQDQAVVRGQNYMQAQEMSPDDYTILVEQV